MKIIPADQRAQNLLRVELGHEYDGWDYDELISCGASGYTHCYLAKTVNWDQCSTRSKGDVIIELAGRLTIEFFTTEFFPF